MWVTMLQFVVIIIPSIIYFGLKYHYNYWKRKKIPYVASNILDFEWYNLAQVDFYSEIYHRLKGHKFGGFYKKFVPTLMVRDPELIKHILIKDFDNFYKRGGSVTYDKKEPITMHLFDAYGSFWKKLRTKLTPAYTSGKMKFMFSLVEECANELKETIEEQIKINDAIDVKEFTTRYTMEVISSCAFGLKTRTIQDVMTDELMTAQCFLFFTAGYDTSSMVLSGALYELALQTDLQKKVQDEIDEYLQKYDNKVTYEMVNSMSYLNRVVAETLRKYPVLGSLSRVCAKDYQIPNTETIIEKDTEVLIPIAGLHSDPEYFPNPELFDPDRFKDFNNYPGRNAYLPFGDGPRTCIGSRFGQMAVKLALVYLLRDFNFESCPMTRSPLEFKPLRFITTVAHEIFLKCNKK